MVVVVADPPLFQNPFQEGSHLATVAAQGAFDHVHLSTCNVWPVRLMHPLHF